MHDIAIYTEQWREEYLSKQSLVLNTLIHDMTNLLYYEHWTNKNIFMYKSSASQFLWTNTWIQSGPDAFGRSNLVMAHLTNFGVKGILCNSRIVLEGKAGKKMSMSSRLGLLKMVLRNNLDLFNTEDKTSKPLNRGGSYCKVTFVQNTIDISPKFTKA